MNVVDSCGWLEYFSNGVNADFFAPIIENEADLIVPSIVIFEVCRRIAQQRGGEAAQLALRFLQKGRVIAINENAMCQAALAAQTHKLAMADAIIWQTAQELGATVYTQDEDFHALPNVVYKAKTPHAV